MNLFLTYYFAASSEDEETPQIKKQDFFSYSFRWHLDFTNIHAFQFDKFHQLTNMISVILESQEISLSYPCLSLHLKILLNILHYIT